MKLFRSSTNGLPANGRIAVVISTWIGNPVDYLLRLMDSMNTHSAGMDYDLFLCANGETYKLPANLQASFKKIFIRENSGFNLGAWDYAWRRLSDYRYFLFLQDDCFIERKNWLLAFYQRFRAAEKCGLIGENLNKGWIHPWDTLRGLKKGTKTISEAKRQRADFYYDKICNWGIDPGETASHLTSVVHFTSSDILSSVDGYKHTCNYEEAIAAEIGFSRSIRALGYRLCQLDNKQHKFIGHRQWSRNSFSENVRQKLKHLASRLK